MPRTKKDGEKPSGSKFSTQTAVIIAGVIIAGAILLTGYLGGGPIDTGNDNNSDTADQSALLTNIRPITADDHVRGSLDAPITIVEYSDLECPFCKRFHDTMNQVVDTYTNGKVLWVYRHFPLDTLHRKARPEAEAAECVAQLAGNEAFWEYVDMIFEITPSNDGLDLALLDDFAADLGIDAAAFADCRAGSEVKQIVQADVDNAIESGGAGTPFAVIIAPDGTRLDLGGAVPFEPLTQAIDQILAEVE